MSPLWGFQHKGVLYVRSMSLKPSKKIQPLSLLIGKVAPHGKLKLLIQGKTITEKTADKIWAELNILNNLTICKQTKTNWLF